MTIEVTVANVIAFFALAVTIAGLAWQYFCVIVGINSRLTALETKTGLFWTVVEKNLSEMLHSPHTEEMDTLLEKLSQDHALSKQEAHQLGNLLELQLRQEPMSPKKLAIVVLLGRVRQFEGELQ